MCTILRTSGLLFTALYLKQCSVALQQYYAGSVNVGPEIYVSLSRSGIPTIIPVHHRHLIKARGERGDFLVRLYLSWFSISRVIKLAKPAATLKSIITDPPDIDAVKEVMGMVKSMFPTLINRYCPWISTIPLEKGLRWVPTWKSLPNDDRQFIGQKANILTSMKYEIASFARDLRLIHSWEGILSP